MKRRIVFTIIMSFFLSSLMTLWITYINLGATIGFISLWGHAFVMAWPAAAVISFFTSPLAQKLTLKILR